MKKKVAVGLSGGVDSAIAAALLIDQGYKVTGIHLTCYNDSTCRADKDRQDALRIALQLKIPFKILDFRKIYKQKVLKYFFTEYKKGRTPNPDIVCNQVIKFGLFYDWALENSFDFVATGHYARILKCSKEHNSSFDCKRSKTRKHGKSLQERKLVHSYVAKLRHHAVGQVATLSRSSRTSFLECLVASVCLAMPRDKIKDQTYFLYRLKQKQLKHLLFPLGDLTKTQVRKIAKQKKLPVANKKDSTGICFVGELNVRNFLKEKLGEREGEVVNVQGKIIGKHPGHWFFTIGQRHGWQRQANIGNVSKFYVINKNKKKNQLVVGTRGKAKRKEFQLEDIHWINNQLKVKLPTSGKKLKTYVRIRHGGKLLSCQLLVINHQLVKVKLDESAFGVAPGQSAVFYQDGIALGGGIIADT